MKTQLGLDLAEHISGSALAEIASWCEGAADMLWNAAKAPAVKTVSPEFRELCDDRDDFRQAAYYMRRVAGYVRPLPVAAPLSTGVVPDDCIVGDLAFVPTTSLES